MNEVLIARLSFRVFARSKINLDGKTATGPSKAVKTKANVWWLAMTHSLGPTTAASVAQAGGAHIATKGFNF